LSPLPSLLARVRKRHSFGAPADRSHSPKLHGKIVDFDHLENLPYSNDVFCALGTTIRKAGSKPEFRRVEFEYPLRLAEHSLATRAQQFVPVSCLVSSVGANAQSGNFYLRTKGEVEEALREQPFARLHIFRPSFLLGRRNENRPGERIGMALVKPMSFCNGWVVCGSIVRSRLK
jgi:hypothetical protein